MSFFWRLRATTQRTPHTKIYVRPAPLTASFHGAKQRNLTSGSPFLHPATSTSLNSEGASYATSAKRKDANIRARKTHKSPTLKGRHGRARHPSPSRPRTVHQSNSLFLKGKKNVMLRAELQSKTATLLAVPIGAWTPSEWRESAQMIYRWTDRINDKKFRRVKGERIRQAREQMDEGHFVAGTAESVLSSFSLLERLLVEYRRVPSTSLAQELIRGELLDAVVINWAYCWERLHPSGASQNTPFQEARADDAGQQANVLLSYNADSVLGRIEAYQARSQGLMAPSAFTYHRLLAAAAASRTNNMATKILDRMLDDNLDTSTGTTTNDSNVLESLLPEQTSITHQTSKPQLGLSRSTYVKFISTCARMGDAAQAEACLEHMYEQSIQPGSEALQPTTKDFNTLLLAWSAYSGDLKYASDRSQGILRRMEELSQPGGALDGKVRPDYFSYTLVMKSLSNWLSAVLTHTLDNGAEYEYVGGLAEGLLNEMEERYKDDERRLRPTIGAYNSALKVLSQLGNAERAEAVLQRMYEDFNVNNNLLAKPETASFDYVLTAWRNKQKAMRASTAVLNSKGQLPSVAIGERAEAILRQMQSLPALLAVKPGRNSYLALLHCWADSRSDEAGERALAVFQEAKAAEKESGEKILNPIFYNVVVQAFATAGDAKNAEKILTEFHRQYHEEGNLDAKPTMYNLSILLNAWAKSNDAKAPERAETILHEMIKLHDEGILDYPPNSISYTSVVECYSKSSLQDATERAAAILNEMDRRSRRGEAHLRPTDVSYRNVMATYASRGMVVEVEEILDRMFQEHKKGNLHDRPTAKAMNLALTALSNSDDPNSGAKAVTFLKRMEQLYNKQLFDGKPDVVSYTLALKCISNSSSNNAGKEAERLLNEMETRASQGETFLAPNTLTYSTVIQIYGRSGKPDKAEAILELMYKKYQDGNTDVAPNTRTFTSVLQAWGRSGLRGSSERALAILDRMKELHRHGVLQDVKPNFFTYTSVLGSLATSHKKADCQRAVELVEEMEALAEEDPEAAPNCFAWNNALRTFANVGDGIKAQELLATMYHKFESGKLASQPNIVSWQTVIEAWSNSKDPDGPFRVVAIWKRMQELHESGALETTQNAKLYLIMLECFSKSSHREIRKHMGQILEDLERLALSSDTRHSLTMFDNLRIIRALARLKDDDMLIKAERLLQGMIKHTDREKWNTNAVKASYSALIGSWRNSRDKLAPDHAGRLQKELEALNISFVSRESVANSSDES